MGLQKWLIGIPKNRSKVKMLNVKLKYKMQN